MSAEGIATLVTASTAAIIALANFIRQNRTHAAVEETKAVIGEVTAAGEPVTLGEAIREIRHDLRTVRNQVDRISRELNGGGDPT